MSEHRSWYQRQLAEEQRYSTDIAYLVSQKVPLAQITYNHKRGFRYDEQARTHKALHAKSPD